MKNKIKIKCLISKTHAFIEKVIKIIDTNKNCAKNFKGKRVLSNEAVAADKICKTMKRRTIRRCELFAQNTDNVSQCYL